MKMKSIFSIEEAISDVQFNIKSFNKEKLNFIKLAVILEFFLSKKNNKQKKLHEVVNNLSASLARNSWEICLNEYGAICGIAHIEIINLKYLNSLIKQGPEAFDESFLSKDREDQSFYHVLLDFWCEVGHTRQFIKHLKETYNNSGNLIYFRTRKKSRIAKIIELADARQSFTHKNTNSIFDNSCAFKNKEFYISLLNEKLSFLCDVGCIFLLLSQSSMHSDNIIFKTLERIHNIVKLEFYKIYQENNETKLIIWCWLTLDKISQGSLDLNKLEYFELSDGDHIVITEIFQTGSITKEKIKELIKQNFPSQEVFYLICANTHNSDQLTPNIIKIV